MFSKPVSSMTTSSTKTCGNDIDWKIDWKKVTQRETACAQRAAWERYQLAQQCLAAQHHAEMEQLSKTSMHPGVEHGQEWLAPHSQMGHYPTQYGPTQSLSEQPQQCFVPHPCAQMSGHSVGFGPYDASSLQSNMSWMPMDVPQNITYHGQVAVLAGGAVYSQPHHKVAQPKQTQRPSKKAQAGNATSSRSPDVNSDPDHHQHQGEETDDPKFKEKVDNIAKGFLTRLQSKEDAEVQMALADFGSWSFKDKMKSCVCQRAFVLARKDQHILAQTFAGKVLGAVKDKFASHVLICFYENGKWEDRAFIAKELAGAAILSAEDVIACRIMCRIVEYYYEEDVDSRSLLEELMVNEKKVCELCEHPFGSFVIRAVLTHPDSTLNHFKKTIVYALCKIAAHCVKQRKASYVIEDALRVIPCGDDDEDDLAFIVVIAIFKHPDLLDLATDRYGRHVFVSMLESSNQKIQSLAYSNLSKIADKLKDRKYGTTVHKKMLAIRKERQSVQEVPSCTSVSRPSGESSIKDPSFSFDSHNKETLEINDEGYSKPCLAPVDVRGKLDNLGSKMDETSSSFNIAMSDDTDGERSTHQPSDCTSLPTGSTVSTLSSTSAKEDEEVERCSIRREFK